MTRLVQAREGHAQRLLLLARHLRSPDSGVLGQGVRFLLAGGVVVVVYVTTTIVLADVIGLHFQIALALGFLVAMAVQFTLYRGFVWRHPEYALPMINFLILRFVIFHAKAQPGKVEDPAPAPFPGPD